MYISTYKSHHVYIYIQATYTWYFDNVVIPSTTQPTYDATQTGNYRVEIEIPLAGGNCIIEDDINITLSSTQSSGLISDYELCDDASNDGIETFDLSTKISEISEGIIDDLTITFYTSMFNAENSIDALPIQYTNTVNPQTIFVKIDNGTICSAISSFELNVLPVPEVNASATLTSCDANYDGLMEFDLTDAEFDIINVRQDNIEITYFENLVFRFS